MVACANVWGFQDLREGPDGGASDATTGGGDDRDEADGRIADDAPEPQDSAEVDAQRDAPGTEAGEAGPIGEGGPLDAASDGPTAADCQEHCPNGCCDSNNMCHPATSNTVCGTQGSACVNCKVTMPCGALQASCCASGGCVCAAIACP